MTTPAVVITLTVAGVTVLLVVASMVAAAPKTAAGAASAAAMLVKLVNSSNLKGLVRATNLEIETRKRS